MKVPVLLPNIFDHPFTYTSKEKLKIGDYVEVPFGKKKMIGIIWDDFEDSFWRLWGGPGRPGGRPGTPKMAWRCHPRGLLRTPGWPKGGHGNQGRFLEEKKNTFSGRLGRPQCG